MMRIESLRRWTLWTYMAVSGFVAIEPSPYEFMFLVALVVFAIGGVRFDKMLAPLIFFLLIYDASGLISLVPFVDEKESFNFIFITIYMSLATIFLAAVVAEAPELRMRTIRSGYVVAGVVSAMLGIVGYFDIAGTGQYFTLYDNTRAMGFFKDPNVFGPFLAPPVVWLFQDMLLKRSTPLAATPKLAVLLLGVLLSFSRGAIFDCLLSIALMLGLTFVAAETPRLRSRTVLVAALGAGLLLTVVVVVLAAPSVREFALERASLAQDYDSGEQGRFGNQIRSIPMLLELPFGFGPQRFAHIFPQDPHQVFISAFGSFGWVGGLAFTAFFTITMVLGWTLCFRRSPRQMEVIAVWSALFPQLVQGFQIDTNHWRHMFLMVSCLYGLAAAERVARASTVGASKPDAAGLAGERLAGVRATLAGPTSRR
jgi:hypothetical protein